MKTSTTIAEFKKFPVRIIRNYLPVLLAAIAIITLSDASLGQTGTTAAPAAAKTAAKPETAEKPAVDPLADGVLVFCGDKNNEPYSFLDASGNPEGYDVDVAKEICSLLGVEAEIRLIDGMENAMQAVASGQCEVILGIGDSPARESVSSTWSLCGPSTVRQYHIAIMQAQYGLDADETSDVRTVLRGARVAVCKSDPVETFFEGSRGTTMITTDSASQAGRLLSSRQVLAIAADENSLRYIASRTHDSNIRMAGKVFYEVKNYGPAVPKTASGELAARISRAISQLKQSGKLADLQVRWNFDYPINPVSLKMFILIGVCGTIALILILGVFSLVRSWQRSLSTAVETRTRKLNAEVEVLRKQVLDLQNRDPSYNSFSGEEPALELVPEGEDDGTRPLVLDQLIKDSVDELQELVGENIKLALQLRDEMPAVMADEQAISKVIDNLCTNARDAINLQKKIAPETPERIWISMRVADDSEKPANMKKNTDPFVALSIRDAGCGIKPDMVQKIFQKGFTTKDNASGEGLSFVYATVAKHGGWIDVESAAGRGATISVFLPAVNM